MLASLARELPRGEWLYEPKWDGFRCLAIATPQRVELRSRHGRPLTRYFPEVVAAMSLLVDARGAVALDGELVIQRGGTFDFAALLSRTHPAASRAARLARETPATFIAFDLVVHGRQDLTATPLAQRRVLLEALLAGAPAGIALTPATRDLRTATEWLERCGRGIDGVVAKALAEPYVPGKRRWVKVKPQRTADCVVAGLRLFANSAAVGSLLLGLWDGPTLRHVGVASSFTDEQRSALSRDLVPLAVPLDGHPWERGFGLEPSPLGRLSGSAGRWDPRTMTLDWTPIRPDRVCEVIYDQLDAGRFRHPARFLRWRPDREPRSCRFEQLAAAPALPRDARGAGA